MTAQNVVLVNIGNTHTQIAVAAGNHIHDLQAIPTAEISANKLPGGLPVALASVVPQAAERLNSLNPFCVSTHITTGIDWSRVDTSTLGADRIANTIYLGTQYQLPAACIDFGTAITFEIIDEQRRFLGGSISPGRKLLREALHDYTAQLPLLELHSELPQGFGDTTASAMRIGIDAGAVGMIKGLMDSVCAQLNRPVTFIAVGGDREFFLSQLPSLKSGGDHFTLNGILKAWELNHEN